MSHDRGCPNCGEDRSAYDECKYLDCPVRRTPPPTFLPLTDRLDQFVPAGRMILESTTLEPDNILTKLVSDPEEILALKKDPNVYSVTFLGENLDGILVEIARYPTGGKS